MNRVASRSERCGDDIVHIEIGIRTPRPADTDGFIREIDDGLMPVNIGIYRDRFNPEFSASPKYTEGDFPAIRNQDSLQHISSAILLSKIEVVRIRREIRWKCRP